MTDETPTSASDAPPPPSSAAARPPKLETLLSAAATTFATRGYSGTSMRDIAHDSGISLSGIYYYTRGKSSLLYEIQSRTIDALLASAAQALSRVSRPSEQLLQFVENHVSYTNDHPAFVRVLSHENAPDGSDERRAIVDAKRNEYVRVLRDILDRVASESAAPVTTAFAADMLFAMMSGPRQWGVVDTELNVGIASRMIYDLFVRGFSDGRESASVR
ncbi:MAG: TetR family transcriptional regulator [Gemmatimonadota bacterium]|nr:TetR family transcriptional regulator [Gemmatimonadota bacterium]